MDPRIKKIKSGGPDNDFYWSSTHFTEGQIDLHREPFDSCGPIASGGWGESVPGFLRLPIATCDFPGWIQTQCPPFGSAQSHTV